MSLMCSLFGFHTTTYAAQRVQAWELATGVLRSSRCGEGGRGGEEDEKDAEKYGDILRRRFLCQRLLHSRLPSTRILEQHLLLPFSQAVTLDVGLVVGLGHLLGVRQALTVMRGERARCLASSLTRCSGIVEVDFVVPG